MVDDETDVERLGFLGALPGFAEQPRLIVGRQRATIRRRRPPTTAEPEDGGDDGVEDVLRRHDQQAHRAVVPLGERHDAREQPALGGVGSAWCGAVVLDVDAEQPHGHDDDVAIAGGLERGGDVRQRVRVAHGDQHVARPGLDLPDREIGRRQQLERVHVVGADLRLPRRCGLSVSASTSPPTSAHVAIAGTSPIASSASSAADATRERRARGPQRSSGGRGARSAARGTGAGPGTRVRRRTSVASRMTSVTPTPTAYACAIHGTRPPPARMMTHGASGRDDRTAYA